MSKAVAGLALAGGRSSRFGREKAAEPVAGRPMLDWCVAALAAHCDRVAVSAAAGSQAEALAREWGLSVLLDDSGYAPGPLRGILAGLAWAAADGRDWLLTLPCDTPRIGADEVARLLAETGDAPAAQAHTSEGPQGLCAVWRTNLAGEVEAALAGERHPPVHRLLASLGARPVLFENAALFANVNTPGELQALEQTPTGRNRLVGGNLL